MRILPLLLLLIPAFAFAQTPQELTNKVSDLLVDSKFQETVTLADQYLAKPNLPRETVVALNTKKAEALVRLGQFQDAEKLLTTCLSQSGNDTYCQAMTLGTQGFLRLNQGRYDVAEEALKKAQNAFEASGKSTSLDAAQVIANLGLVYMSAGKYEQAEEQLQMALSLRQAMLKGSHELIAATYNDLGLVYSATNKDKALDYYEQKALPLYTQLHGAEHSKIAITNINIGIIYRELELHGDAMNNFEAALKIWNKVYPGPHPTKAFALYNLGVTYATIGNKKAAAEYYAQSRKMYEESYGFKHPEVTNVLNAQGNLLLSENQYDEALKTYQKAIQANVRDFNSNDLLLNPRVRDYYHGTRLLYSLLFKAEALEARYYRKTVRFADLRLALSTLHSCDTLIDILRQQTTNELDKIQLAGIADEVYGDGVRIAQEAGISSPNKRKYYEEAFYFAEKSKGAVLLEAISDANAKSFAGIPEKLLEEEHDLNAAIKLTAQKLAQKPSAEEEKYLRETSFALKRSYEAFIQTLEKQFPDYYNLKFNPVSPSITQLQSLLDDKTALLSYFIDEKQSHIGEDLEKTGAGNASGYHLFIFSITKKSFSITDHALPPEFNKYVTGLRNGLFFRDLNTYTLSARKLHDVLIPKIPKRIEKLVVLPTRNLGVIPFEALLTRETTATDYKTLPYLINRFDIRYEFSGGLILQKSKEQKAVSSPAILLCAPVSFPPKDGLNDLPGTETEVKAISDLFQSRNLKNASFVNREASEQLVKSDKIGEFNLLHFATHGVVDENNPELSRVFLQSGTEAEDGHLFSGEIYNLKLRANLVTLSACQTGLGKISKGEGVVGLSRALAYAGAKNILVSFWSVGDESTAALMTDFYGQLLKGDNHDYSQNLRKAKLDLIQKGDFSTPYYWAPFVLIGF
jgi:CHAT domain-containing protein/Flp pilus assembly protein TadD